MLATTVLTTSLADQRHSPHTPPARQPFIVISTPGFFPPIGPHVFSPVFPVGCTSTSGCVALVLRGEIMACCKACCGCVDCAEGDEGKCCCGGSGGECCDVGEYCCSGSCQATPCEACSGHGDCGPGDCCVGGTCFPYTGEPAVEALDEENCNDGGGCGVGEQCCPAGCCPELWICCPDNLFCADHICECPNPLP